MHNPWLARSVAPPTGDGSSMFLNWTQQQDLWPLSCWQIQQFRQQTPPLPPVHTWSLLVYDSASSLMHAPLAALMRLSAMEPDASTTNMTSAPALRANFLLRMSPFSTYTRRRAFFSAMASLRRIWSGEGFGGACTSMRLCVCVGTRQPGRQAGRQHVRRLLTWPPGMDARWPQPHRV